MLSKIVSFALLLALQGSSLLVVSAAEQEGLRQHGIERELVNERRLPTKNKKKKKSKASEKVEKYEEKEVYDYHKGKGGKYAYKGGKGGKHGGKGGKGGKGRKCIMLCAFASCAHTVFVSHSNVL